jgi:hypothetical protein
MYTMTLNLQYWIVFIGLLIFASVCVLAVITRYYVVSALRASDVEVSALGYIDFLRVSDLTLIDCCY